MTYFWIAIGSALGGMARYWSSGLVTTAIGGTFPWGTLCVNILGSFVIGFFATLTTQSGRINIHPDARHFVMAGLCGGYTTFSAFSLQTFQLASEGRVLEAGMNSVLSVILCLMAVWLGYACACLLARTI